MSERGELSMRELAQIALGGSGLGTINVAVLHQIIILILKKMDCENEKVTLQGVPAEEVKKLLDNAPAGSLFKFDIETMTFPGNLICLENQIDDLERNLNDHIESFAVRHNDDDDECKTKCTAEEIKDDSLDAIRKNGIFLTLLESHMREPIIKGLDKIECNISELKIKMKTFQSQSGDWYKYSDFVLNYADELKILRERIDESHKIFGKAMIEVQNCMDSKSNNLDVFPIKTYIKKLLTEATRQVNLALIPQTMSFYVGIIPGHGVITSKKEKLRTCEAQRKICKECHKILDVNEKSLRSEHTHHMLK